MQLGHIVKVLKGTLIGVSKKRKKKDYHNNRWNEINKKMNS